MKNLRNLEVYLKLANKNEHDNMVIATIGGFSILMRFLFKFYGSSVFMSLQEVSKIKSRRVDHVECVERLPKASDGIEGWDDLTPV